MNNNLFAEILFNKITGLKTKIYINSPILNTGNFIHYKSKVIGGIRWCPVNTISYKYQLQVFGQVYDSEVMIMGISQHMAKGILVSFLSRFGFSILDDYSEK